jgi:hypothetical protein
VAATALANSERPAHAVIYCKYVGWPKGCVARADVVLAPAPAVVVAPAPVVRRRIGVGVNRGGPVNQIGVR